MGESQQHGERPLRFCTYYSQKAIDEPQQLPVGQQIHTEDMEKSVWH